MIGTCMHLPKGGPRGFGIRGSAPGHEAYMVHPPSCVEANSQKRMAQPQGQESMMAMTHMLKSAPFLGEPGDHSVK